MTTAYVTHPRYTEHDMTGHPEHAGRILTVWKRLEEAGLTGRLKAAEATAVDDDLLRTVHTTPYLDLLGRTLGQTRLARLDADTYVTPTSYDIARLSAGGLVRAVETVLRGEANNALAITRPPGHHAMPDRAMGFCLLGNIALGARYAQKAFGLERIMIVDYDVHHGNGTEAMFYDDPSVLFISSHEWPLYPGTGALTDIGEGTGQGYNVNIPLAAGNGDSNYAALYEQVIWPLAERFRPQLILVSAGHDAHWIDPLANMRLSLAGYDHLNRELILMAKELCGGRIVFLMEGGYDLDALSYGWCNVARALLGDDTVVDPLGLPRDQRPEPDIAPLIERLHKLHGLS